MAKDDRKTTQNGLLQLAVVVGALLLGGMVGGALYYLRPEPERVEREQIGPLVETMIAQREDVSVTVRGHGTAEARVESAIVPEVSGRVTAVHEELVAGGYIEAGEVLLAIAEADYQLALNRARTELEQAEAAEETAEAQIAEAEANLADAERELERARDLADRNAASQRDVERAQLAQDVAEAALRGARSSLSTAQAQRSAAEVAMDAAELDLERTRVTLPFDAVVVDEQVSVGQFVTAGQSVGQVYGTSVVEIAVPLEDREVGWLAQMPMAFNRGETGATAEAGQAGSGRTAAQQMGGLSAEVSGEFFGRWCVWLGQVVRTEGQMDRQSRMVRVVVRVEDPFAGVDVGAVPLMPGAFVEVAMEGRELQGVIGIPRYALHENDEVWVAEDGRLRVRQVVVARRDRDRVYLREGVSEGEQVILSALNAVTDGMLVRTIVDDEPQDAPQPEETAEVSDGQR